MPEPSPEAIDAFIVKWANSGGHERGSGQYFLLDFRELLGLEKPSPPVAENERNAYTFERRVDSRSSGGVAAPDHRLQALIPPGWRLMRMGQPSSLVGNPCAAHLRIQQSQRRLSKDAVFFVAWLRSPAAMSGSL